MPNEGTESQFEATTIDRLLALAGYRYQYGGEIERDLRDVVMSDCLRGFLQKKYPHLLGDAVEEAIARASRPDGVTPEQRNKNFHALFTRGFEQKYRKTDGTEAIEHIYVVDWEKPAANDFCVVNQLAIRGQNDRRPDIIIYLNGFPIVLFELKNRTKNSRTRSAHSTRCSITRLVFRSYSISTRSLSFRMAAWSGTRMTTRRTRWARRCTECGRRRGSGSRLGRASTAARWWKVRPVQ